MTLSYDMVFFALVRGALAGDRYVLRKKRCAFHPLKKRVMMTGSPSLEYAAYINSILVYYKLLDDVSDERGIKRAASRVLSGAAAKIKKKARGLSSLEEKIKEGLSQLADMERARTGSPDEAAEAFGRVMAECLSYGLPERQARIAYEAGRHTGRAVYLADAACDFRKDRKSGSYNPFVIAFNGKMGEDGERLIKDAVLMELASLERVLRLIDYTDFDLTRECVMNVAVFGIKNAFFSEFEKEKQHD